MKTKLLNIDANPKTVKGSARGYMTAVLYLAPHDSSGIQLCPTANLAGCAATCLNTAGRGGMAKGSATFETASGTVLPDNAIQHARLRRTALFHQHPVDFMAQLMREIDAFLVKAKRSRKLPAIRLNGTSDIRWEMVPVTRNGKHYPHIFAAYPRVQFYDYTKIPNRHVTGIANYHLTFSYSGRAEYAPIVVKALRNYSADVSFAAVFNGPAPEYFLGRPVINGDETDLRFLDRAGVVVALTAKGRARRDTSGFVIDTRAARIAA
jgi:hypothetical protein